MQNARTTAVPAARTVVARTVVARTVAARTVAARTIGAHTIAAHTIAARTIAARTVAAPAAVVLALAAGCASSGRPAPPARSSTPLAITTTRPAGSGPPTAASSPYSSTLTVAFTEADNNGSVVVHPGTIVEVTLSSTYWTFAPVSAPKVLTQSAPRVHPAAPGVHSVPGSGKGTVQETFRARGAGTAVITAARTSCGEAMRCSPAQTAYRITITVR